MRIPFDKKWQLFLKEDYANYFFVYSTWEGYTYMPEKWGFENGRFMAAEFINGACNLFMPQEYYDEMNRRNYRSLFGEPEKWDKLHKINDKASAELFAFSRHLLEKDPKKLSNKQILDILREFFRIQNLVHVPRGPIWQMETPDNILNNYLYSYLEEQKKEKRSEIDTGEAFRILTAPLEDSILTKERYELASVASITDKKKKDQKLEKHAVKYEWLEYGLQGRILSKDHFQRELEEIEKEGSQTVLERIKEFKAKTIQEQKKIIKALNIGKTHQRIFKIVRGSLFSRLYSKYAQFYAYYCLEGLLKEIGSRFSLSLEETRFLSIKDYESMLARSGADKTNWGSLARSHKSHSLQISDEGQTEIWTGEDADRVMKKVKWKEGSVESSQSDEIKGQPAFKGQAKGRVKIINTVQELAKMHSGNVLVSHMTNPDIVPAMKMAVAIVTDLGGITCHAAIVARELRKPCIIGTKIATKVLKDGDLVEVDAEKGIIKKI
ncbi:MAG: hypothetical protein A3B98_02905 [Candidatus Taylorbacteria bacterium RIFCSPHIGHO2_02_FULL_43_55]|nr:MAG: hypothetical protein A3B98_02905 [Candidatus Taylorbacteria bacterium RIFCSPHIGHO2_02_FULL_43_55]OHA31951.1 MAG: hypothetical protein A3B09_01025 [Candidatus Taylorbacteria bacterium RIFCSPLOWO2_01_FULL_43_83]